MPLILALRRQKQADIYKFEASLVYKESSRTTRAVTQRNHALKNQANKKESKSVRKAAMGQALLLLESVHSSKAPAMESASSPHQAQDHSTVDTLT